MARHHKGALSQTTGGRALGTLLGGVLKAGLVCMPFAVLCLLRRDYAGLTLCYGVYAGWIVRTCYRVKANCQETSKSHD